MGLPGRPVASTGRVFRFTKRQIMQGPRPAPCSSEGESAPQKTINYERFQYLHCIDCNSDVATIQTPPGDLAVRVVRAVIICPECYERRAKNEATVMTRIMDTSPITPDTCYVLGFTQLEEDPNVWFLDQGGEVLSVVFVDGRAVIPVLDSFTERNSGQLTALVIAASKGTP
jgi:hypothetical protein